MSIGTILLIIKVSFLIAALTVYFWPRIRTFLNGTVRNRIEKTFGKVSSERFAKFLVWIDKGMTLARKFVQRIKPGLFGETISGKITKTTVTPIQIGTTIPTRGTDTLIS